MREASPSPHRPQQTAWGEKYFVLFKASSSALQLVNLPTLCWYAAFFFSFFFWKSVMQKVGNAHPHSVLRPFAANLLWQGPVMPGLLLPRKRSRNNKMTGKTLADQSRETMKKLGLINLMSACFNSHRSIYFSNMWSTFQQRHISRHVYYI